MTIFDTIRYPISNPPTAEEFEAVPPRLLRKWIKKTEWSQYMPEAISRSYIPKPWPISIKWTTPVELH